MKYFFDSYALIEIVKQNPNYARFLEEPPVTSVLNAGETYLGLARDYDEKKAQEWLSKARNNALPVELSHTISGMQFKLQHPKKNFSFVDCVSYAMAQERGLLFLTGDKEFKDVPGVEFVK